MMGVRQVGLRTVSKTVVLGGSIPLTPANPKKKWYRREATISPLSSWGEDLMVAVAQWVRASGCGPEGCGFEFRQLPHNVERYRKVKLENIGFYTLSDSRAKNASMSTPLWRCELLLTDKCNFSCPYCRGMRKDFRGTLTYDEAKFVVDAWLTEGLKNIRFSGGEPTLWKGLDRLVSYCRDRGVDRVAISTNGSADTEYYIKLYEAGVNDFSMSLDACCASVGDYMAGGINGAWEKVIKNIRILSKLTYVTVGMVFTDENILQVVDSVKFASSLGVSDIRVVPSAQFNEALVDLDSLDDEFLSKHPILSYRIRNVRKLRNVRKMQDGDSKKCRLALDDMDVVGGYHFPCIIYLREGGNPIGKVGSKTRQERAEWVEKHDSWSDPICREMCLDVCIDYNNVANYECG